MYLEKEEMKFAALYTVKQYKAPLSMSRIYEILTWDGQVMEYFDLAAVLDELLEDGYLEKKFYRDEEAFYLTKDGESADLFFKKRVPFSVRHNIDEVIGHIRYDELAAPDAVRAEVIPVTEELYGAKCTIVEGRATMLDMVINMGTKAQAQRVADYFKENADEIYAAIIDACVPDDGKIDNRKSTEQKKELKRMWKKRKL